MRIDNVWWQRELLRVVFSSFRLHVGRWRGSANAFPTLIRVFFSCRRSWGPDVDMSSDGACERGTPASTRYTYDRLFQTLMVRKPRTVQGSCAGTDHFMIGLGILARSHLIFFFFFIFLRRCSLERGGAVRCLDNLKRGMGDIQTSLDRRSLRRN